MFDIQSMSQSTVMGTFPHEHRPYKYYIDVAKVCLGAFYKYRQNPEYVIQIDLFKCMCSTALFSKRVE